MIDRFKPGTGKSEYIKALALINLGQKSEACTWLKASVALGYPDAQKALDQWCSAQ